MGVLLVQGSAAGEVLNESLKCGASVLEAWMRPKELNTMRWAVRS